MVAELFRIDRQANKWADGRTDMTQLIVAFRNFAKAPKTIEFLIGSPRFLLRECQSNEKNVTEECSWDLAQACCSQWRSNVMESGYYLDSLVYTRWFKYDRDDLCVNKSQFVPVIFEPLCTSVFDLMCSESRLVADLLERNWSPTHEATCSE
jgi:hypothetical protein